MRQAGEYAASKGLEVALELEPFNEALLKDVHELVRFVNEVNVPAVLANADISHLHLSDASFTDVALMKGMIGHIHLSDCDGKVHGDMPAGMGVTPIKEYLQAIVDTGYEGTVSIELEYAPGGHGDHPLGAACLRRNGRDHARRRGARLTSITPAIFKL